MELLNDVIAQKAADYLTAVDPLLASTIREVGPCPIRPHHSYYQELVESIIGQQLSVKAAAAIEGRFVALFPATEFPSPEQILSVSPEDLRAIGFSYAKAKYVQDLAVKVLDGSVSFDHLDALSNDEVITALTPIKGVGEWTVHMFLIFCMGRTDVLPVGDLGVRNGIRALYGFTDAPTPEEVREVAAKNHWHPYESIASWYIWQSLKNTPNL